MSGQTQSIKALTTEMFLQEQEKDEFCKKAKKKFINEKERRTKLMEQYLAAEADGKENNKTLRENENKEYEDDLDEDEQIKEFNNGLIGTAEGKYWYQNH
jgi:thioredoxin-related protein